jgi:hypothetical protein
MISHKYLLDLLKVDNIDSGVDTLINLLILISRKGLKRGRFKKKILYKKKNEHSMFVTL